MSPSTGTMTGFQHVYQPGSNADSPTLVLFHGTGGDENSLLDLGRTLDGNANLLGIRGKSREEGLNRFFRRFSEGVFDEHDIMLQADHLTKFLEQAKAHYSLKGPMIAVGYSNGANIAAALLLLSPSLLDGAVLLRGSLPLRPAAVPQLHGRSVLILSGGTDPISPLDSAKDLADLLKEARANVSLRVIPAGHQLTRADVQLGIAWLAGESLEETS